MSRREIYLMPCWRLTRRKTSVATRTDDTHVSVETIADFLGRRQKSQAKGTRVPTSGSSETNINVLLHVRAHEGCPVSWL